MAKPADREDSIHFFVENKIYLISSLVFTLFIYFTWPTSGQIIFIISIIFTWFIIFGCIILTLENICIHGINVIANKNNI
jgi:hypothetical protein